jgi:MoxR-like ATPase
MSEANPSANRTLADALSPDEIRAFADRFAELSRAVERAVLGQTDVVRSVLVALLAGGHVLLEGPPGIGKTLLSRTLAHAVGVEFRRLQFTPDLMPSDVTGGNVYNQKVHEFEFRPGPVFTQILLADEVNRAPAKTQSALLEAMSDRQVSVDGATRPLPSPFFVIATQNPIESEGTYPLPEAQLDRFLVKVLVAHPSVEVEVRLLQASLRGFDAGDLATASVPQVVDEAAFNHMVAVARRVRVADDLCTYIARVVARTRTHPAVALGASPRASLALLRSAQVVAASEGRGYVVPDDIKEMARPVLRHRFLMQADAELDGLTPDAVVDAVLVDVPVPGGERSG